MSFRDTTSGKVYLKRLHVYGSSSRIFKAQQKNKRNACRLSNKSLKEKESFENKSALTRDQLIRKYAYLVGWVVNRIPALGLRGIERDDLIGYGTIGLIESIDRFDPSKSSNFESFAIARIRGSIYDELRSSDWLSRGSRKKVKNLFRVTGELEKKLNRYPTNIELANELSISLVELRKIQLEAQMGIFSLDEPRDSFSEDSVPIMDNVSSNENSFLEEMEENELKERLAKAVENLPEKEKTVIGLYHYKRLTFKEIAEVMDFSESRASQIHARAIALLKSKMLRD